MTADLDPITVEVIGASLSSIVEEMGETLVKASFSPNIKERRDCTAALFDASGHIVAQAEQIPIHLGSLMGIVQALLDAYPAEELRPGDVFIGNDPHTGGGTHLPDIVLAEPLIIDGTLRGWVANLAHHADFEDRGHRHIFQEGLRIPPIRLGRDGVPQPAIMRLFLTNCQVPDERRSDIAAQLAANRRGTLRWRELVERYGADTLERASAQLLDHTERLTRAGIAAIPDGRYAFADRLDNEGLPEELTMSVAVEVAGDTITFDFTGNPPQVEGPQNMVRSALLATVYYAMKTLLDEDLPPNAGLHRPITVVSEPGTIVDATAPAAVNSRMQAGQRVVDLIHGALGEAVPDRVIAATNGACTALSFAGTHPRTGEYYIYLETIGGGSGAACEIDGADAVQVHLTNTSNLPVESLETEYPLTVEAYELAADSGGAGRRRGGLGIRRRIRVEAPTARVRVSTSRQTSRPWGFLGGGPAGPARVTYTDGVRAYGGVAVLRAGQAVTVQTAGGGGYGPAAQRAPQDRARDRTEGIVAASGDEQDREE